MEGKVAKVPKKDKDICLYCLHRISRVTGYGRVLSYCKMQPSSNPHTVTGYRQILSYDKKCFMFRRIDRKFDKRGKGGKIIKVPADE